MISKTDLAREHIEKYINIALKNKKQFSKRYLATVLYNEYPDIFTDVEDARNVIRYVLGTNGTSKRNSIKGKDEIARKFALIPEEIRDTSTSAPYIIPTAIKKTLLLADIHGRFYNKKALEIAINYGLTNRCDSVIIDGDFVDFYANSKFDKNPSVQKIFEEQEWGQDILQLLQDTFGYVVLNQGNHDVRREKQIERLATSMPELMEFSKYEDYMFFNGCTTNFVEDYRHIIYGKLNIIHGHEYYGGGGIHVAWNRLNKASENILSAHSHKPQSAIKPTINGHILGSWSLGCLCDLSPRYAPKNDWANGFALVEKESSGDFIVDNRVVYGNKTFPA